MHPSPSPALPFLLAALLVAPSASRADEVAFPEQDYNVEKPAAGVDTAQVTGRPAWCDKAPTDEAWSPGRIGRTVGNKYGTDGTVEGAARICARADDPSWQKEAGYILQKWMNWTHLPQSDAERSLRARIQTESWKAQRQAACEALALSPEATGPDKAYGDARLQFFGCRNENQTLWQDASQINPTAVGYFLDGELEVDPLARAYWVAAMVREPRREIPSTSPLDNVPLLYYAVARNDFNKLDQAAILQQLEAAPYANDYTRAVTAETLGWLKARQRIYEAATDKLAKGDEDYTAILRAAPDAAFASWDKLVAAWRPELERSLAFEKLLSKPSRKALKGCSAGLVKDGEKVVRSFHLDEYQALSDKIAADPIANLLLGRLAVCFAADKVPGSGALRDLTRRGLRGPRTLAYYAIVDALVEAKKDRPKMVLDLPNFLPNGAVLRGSFEAPGADLEFSGHAPSSWQRDTGRGVVLSVQPVEQGLQVTFKKVIVRLEDTSCTDDTSHPLRITADGRIEYYRHCKALGTFTNYDQTPSPIVVSPLFAAALKPGVFLQWVATNPSVRGPDLALPVSGKRTAADKKLLSFFGFSLQ